MELKSTSLSSTVIEERSVPLNGNRADSFRPSDKPAKSDIGAILRPVRSDLERVEAKLTTVDESLFQPLADAFADLVGSGGKRLRPAIALLASQLRRNSNHTDMAPAVILLAASLEMLHTATLVHDDVIDGALMRRGAPTLNAIWHRGATVLAGDYMFARAAGFAAETQNPRVIRIFSDTLGTIVNGELRQLWARRQFHQHREEYYERIQAKTASLFGAAAEAAGVLAGMPESEISALRDYGYSLGVAFQIVDDILDFAGDASTLGKPAGSDLMQGTMTLPFFYYVQTLADPDELLDRMESGFEDAAEDADAWQATVAQVASAVKSSSAIEASREEAVVYLRRAKDAINGFPDSRYRSSLYDLCDFVAQRTY